MSKRTVLVLGLVAAALVAAGAAAASVGGDEESLTAGDGAQGTQSAEVVRGCADDEAGMSSGDAEEFSFDGLDDWVANASVIAKVEVVSETSGDEADSTHEGDPPESARNLELRIIEPYSGSVESGSPFWIRAHEPFFGTGDERTVATGPGCFGLLVGDTAIVALYGDGKSPDNSSLLTGDSVLLEHDGVIASTRRTSPVLDQFEGRPVEEVEAEVREAAERG